VGRRGRHQANYQVGEDRRWGISRGRSAREDLIGGSGPRSLSADLVPAICHGFDFGELLLLVLASCSAGSEDSW
jgi:hypothetical protein